MRRILLLATVAAMMAVTAAFGAAPAMAQSGGDLAEFVYDATKNPQKELRKLDQNIKRNVLPEYEELVKDADKTADEAISDDFFPDFEELFKRVNDAFSPDGGDDDGSDDDGDGGGGGGPDCGSTGCGG